MQVNMLDAKNNLSAKDMAENNLPICGCLSRVTKQIPLNPPFPKGEVIFDGILTSATIAEVLEAQGFQWLPISPYYATFQRYLDNVIIIMKHTAPTPN